MTIDEVKELMISVLSKLFSNKRTLDKFSEDSNVLKYNSEDVFVAKTGTLLSMLVPTAPRGWLECDGSIYNITDYQNLSAYIQTQYGTTNYFGGDGIDTFGLPDFSSQPCKIFIKT